MSDVGVKIRCQRCGDQMDLRDPPPGTPWQPNQFWVCQKCGRHYWTTYPTQPGAAAVGTGRTSRCRRSGETRRRIISTQAPMNTSPSDDDEDDEILEDEEFDEDAESDEDDEDDADDDDEEEGKRGRLSPS